MYFTMADQLVTISIKCKEVRKGSNLRIIWLDDLCVRVSCSDGLTKIGARTKSSYEEDSLQSHLVMSRYFF